MSDACLNSCDRRRRIFIRQHHRHAVYPWLTVSKRPPRRLFIRQLSVSKTTERQAGLASFIVFNGLSALIVLTMIRYVVASSAFQRQAVAKLVVVNSPLRRDLVYKAKLSISLYIGQPQYSK